jgi:FkbM family methyltransferase
VRVSSSHRPVRTSLRAAATVGQVLRWPVRSMASAKLVSGLVAQGVRPPLVVDVGANRGQFAVAVLELMPATRVISFEPQPAQAAELSALSARYAPRLDVRAMALGTAAGELPLQVNEHHQSSSFRPVSDKHRAAFPTAVPAREVLVPIDRLDAQLAPDDVPAGSLLKLDVQGFEREVLDGAAGVLGRFEHLLLELSFSPMYDGEPLFEEMLAHVSSLGFRFLRPVGHLLDPGTREYLQFDALFIAGQ